MAGCHSCHTQETVTSPVYKKILWFALVANFAMFVVELSFGYQQGSVALKADALDFFGDAATYAITLMVLTKSLQTRAKVGMLKGLSLAGFGIFILFETFSHYSGAIQPNAPVMGGIAVLALVVNVICAALLYFFREGDSNIRSVWICSRNDAGANIAVVVAAWLVYYLQSNVPDLAVGFGIALLGVWSGTQICKQAYSELKETKHV